jgi:hypothetical protein
MENLNYRQTILTTVNLGAHLLPDILERLSFTCNMTTILAQLGTVHHPWTLIELPHREVFPEPS